MQTRVAIIGIIVEDVRQVDALNRLLHEYGDYILSRMGLPYRKRDVNIISISLEAPQDVINSLAGRIGRLQGITAKTVYSSLTYPED